jgi:cytochrome c oxidase subunit 2
MMHLLSKIAVNTPSLLAQTEASTPEPRELTGNFWLPEAASTLAPGTDFAFMAITWLCYFFFAGIVIALVYFCWKYRQRGTEVVYQADAPVHNTPLEVGWTVLPLLLVVAIFFMGFKGFLDLSTPPRNAYEINVTAYQWGWSFKYPNGATSPHLVVPAAQPVKLVMRSSDVLHSLYIPDFRVKKDVVPGRYSYLWFQCDEPTGLVPEDQMNDSATGHHLFCTEYCGTDHSNMNRKVFVLAEDEFEQWEEEQARWLDKVSDEELYSVAGPKIYANCSSCHSIDGGAKTGPSWGNPTSGSLTGLGDVWKRTVEGSTPVTGGTKGRPGTTLADYIGPGKLYETPEDYIRASIYNPGEILVGGFGPNMPHFRGQLGDRAIDAVIGMMKQLDQFDAAGKFVGSGN